MHVLHRGAKKEKFDHEHYWVGVELTCRQCKCVFTLEQDDKPFVVDGKGISVNDDYHAVNCPHCKQLVVAPTASDVDWAHINPDELRFFRLDDRGNR